MVINFSKAFDLIPHDKLLAKIEATGVDLRVVVWVKVFLLGRWQRVRINGQISEEVRVNFGVQQGSRLGPLIYVPYVKDIWRNNESNIWLFADDCIIYKKIMNISDIDMLQMDQNSLGEWAVENEMVVYPGKSKAVSFTKDGVKERTRYYFGDQLIAEVSTFKYLGIIIGSKLTWSDHVNYTLRNAWKALHFIMHTLKWEIIIRNV